MEILIACNDHTIAKALRACLSKLGIECGASQVLSHDSALLAAANFREGLPGLVFFGSPHLTADDLTALTRLCAAAADRFKVVVVGHNLAAETILRAVRSGAIDCLSLDGALETELRHLLDRLQSSSDDRNSAGQLF